MPSENHLALYKNSIDQKPGVLKEMLKWMKDEAALRKLPPHGYCGGLICDEVSIQVDYYQIITIMVNNRYNDLL